MNTYDIKKLALILAVQAEIDAMKTENNKRMLKGEPPTYNEDEFIKAANHLRNLAYKPSQPPHPKG